MLDNLRKRLEPREENDIEYMDTTDQIKMINKMRLENEESNKTFRVSHLEPILMPEDFLLLCSLWCPRQGVPPLCVLICKVYASFMQYLYPYNFLFHMALYDFVSSESIIGSELASCKLVFSILTDFKH